MANATTSRLVEVLRQLQLLDATQLNELSQLLETRLPDLRALATEVVRRGWLTLFQMNQVLAGKGGQLVLGPYLLLDRIGEGGMGQVFKARHRLMNRVVALKIIRKEKLANADAIRRFHREIQAAAALSHPNIVIAHDAAQFGDVHLLVMEYVEGFDLAQRVKDGGPLPVALACEYVRQAASGLAHAHEKGMVHRDIKPANLLVGKGSGGQTVGVVKILDMGLARLNQQSDPTINTVTQEGAVMGTPDFIAPEQAMDTHNADIRADIYSLGCTFYFLLAGRAPFQGNSLAEVLVKHQLQAATPLAQLRADAPPKVCEIIDRMMAKKPEERFQTPGEVAEVLGAMIQRNTSVKIGTATGPTLTPPSSSVGSPTAESLTSIGDATENALPRTAATETIAVPGPRPQGLGRRVAAVAWYLLMVAGRCVRGLFRLFRKLPGKYQAIVGGTGLLVLLTCGFLLVTGLATPILSFFTGPLPTAAPVSSQAMVPAPAIPRGVTSWTLETRGHRGGVEGAAYSPDGQYLATVGADGTLRLWEPGSGRLIRAILGSPGAMRCVCWSADSRVIACGCGDTMIRLWEAASGRLLFTLKGHGGGIEGLAWSPDGKTLASAGWQDATVRLWHAPSGQLLETLKGHTREVSSVAWSHDSKTLASGSIDGTVRLWDAATRQPLRSFQAEDVVYALAWSPDGRVLASGSHNDGKIILWEAKSGRPLHRLKHGSPIYCLAFARDSKSLASGQENGSTVRLWDVTSGQPLHTLQGHEHHVRGVSWSPDGKTVASASRDATVRLWDAAKGSLIQTIPGHPDTVYEAVEWSPDGKLLALRSQDFTVRFWDVARRETLRTLQRHPFWIGGAAWAPDSKKLATANQEGTVGVWDVATGQAVHMLRGHERGTASVAWSASTGTLASSGGDGAIQLWDPVKGSSLATLTGHASGVTLAWSPDGKTLASGGYDSSARLWDVARRQARHTLVGHGRAVSSMAWAPDGKSIASSCHDGLVRIWTADTGQLANSLPGHRGEVNVVAWSPRGQFLASGGSDGTIRLWDGKNIARADVINAHARPVVSLAWSPDGRVLSSGSMDQTVRFWEPESGRLLASLYPLRDYQGVLISPQGHFHASLGMEQRELICVVQTDQGQEVLMPEEFARKYGWKNDPARVQLNADPMIK